MAGILYQDSGGLPLLEIGYPDHDRLGNRLNRSENGAATLYGYDALYRLSQAAGAANETFIWDAAGNRITGPTGAESYSHDAAGRMSTGSQGGYGYDALGNQTSRTLPGGSWSLVWNGQNQLTQAASATTTVNFKYDPFGRRIEKKVIDATGTTTHTYVYDGEDIAFESVYDGTATTTTHYVHGPGIDEPLAMVRGGQVYCYHADGLGSIVALTDNTQAVVQSYSYEVFGLAAPSGSMDQPYGFTGRELDSETGLMFYRARYFDPAEGRWISKDPLTFGGGDPNLYRYVGNNVPNFTDPSGKIIPVLAVLGGTALIHAGANAIVWATMKASAYFMGNPEIPGTVGNYRMNNLTDDMAIASAGVGLLGSTASTAAVVGGVEVAGAVSGYVVNVCSMGMVAAGTPQGQYIADRATTFLSGRFGPVSKPSNGYEAIGTMWGLYDDYKKFNK